ncbi:2-hydroxyacid dehydrogenase [Pseudomonas sp. G(2018)]|uniref:2-hydroxyacid dehydrogenase n=1 Tax=Pseudomonas sp. G(2018) TaxID=2502242 RepID=UPI0014857AF3|nr:NAD(P)-dependent oxidoreductase [Pseudomonas sp. G(2018)]
MRKILVTGDFSIGDNVFPEDFELIHIRCPIDEQQILDVLSDVQDYILGGPEYLSARFIDHATRLENLVVMGTGTASFVDIEYATKKGIRIANTPHMNIQAVVEFTLAMMTTCLAKVFESVERVKDGTQWIQTPWRSLSELSFGFVGMGGIGSEMAHQLHLRGCRNISYWSRSQKVELETSLGLRYESLDHIVNTVDVLCILITSCDETYHLIDEAVLKKASSELKIFNLSDSNIICPVALKKYLLCNSEAFCFMDGYYSEWVRNQGQYNDAHGLLTLPSKSLIVTSHLAAQEKETVNKLFAQAVRRILEFGCDRLK